MKVRVIQPHITAHGPVAVDAVLDLHDDHAADYINAKLAVLHGEQANAQPIEQATRRRRNIETR